MAKSARGGLSRTGNLPHLYLPPHMRRRLHSLHLPQAVPVD